MRATRYTARRTFPIVIDDGDEARTVRLPVARPHRADARRHAIRASLAVTR